MKLRKYLVIVLVFSLSFPVYVGSHCCPEGGLVSCNFAREFWQDYSGGLCLFFPLQHSHQPPPPTPPPPPPPPPNHKVVHICEFPTPEFPLSIFHRFACSPCLCTWSPGSARVALCCLLAACLITMHTWPEALLFTLFFFLRHAVLFASWTVAFLSSPPLRPFSPALWFPPRRVAMFRLFLCPPFHGVLGLPWRTGRRTF